MTVSNLRAGSVSGFDASMPPFSANPAPNGPSIHVDGLQNGTNSTLQFTVSGCDVSKYTVGYNADRSAVLITVSALSGSGSAAYLVDTSVNVKTAGNGTSVLSVQIKVGTGGTTTYTFVGDR